MKRPTAEVALKYEFDNIKEQIRILYNEIAYREAKIAALQDVGNDMDRKIQQLKSSRSKVRKP